MTDKAPRHSGLTRLLLPALLAAVVVAVVTLRFRGERELAAVTLERAIPKVATTRPGQLAGNTTLTLPASLQALSSAPIHPRTTGYVRKWFVDIGDFVHQGQLLALLDAPDVQQQLDAAQADLQTALANQRLATTTAERWKDMLASNAVSRQEADEKMGDLAAKTGNANAAQANVERLKTMSGFTRITAPFDGVVTSRSIEIGALVTAGNTAAAPLFTIADQRIIRAAVRVPQLYSALVRPGMRATLALPELPGQTFPATVKRTADAVDPSSGTLLVELEAPNEAARLKPGAYAQTTFALPSPANVVTIPASALVLNEKGAQVAVVTPGGRAEVRPVTLGRDQGKVIEVASGLSPADAVIVNPPDALQTGDPVRVVSGEESPVQEAAN